MVFIFFCWPTGFLTLVVFFTKPLFFPSAVPFLSAASGPASQAPLPDSWIAPHMETTYLHSLPPLSAPSSFFPCLLAYILGNCKSLLFGLHFSALSIFRDTTSHILSTRPQDGKTRSSVQQITRYSSASGSIPRALPFSILAWRPLLFIPVFHLLNLSVSSFSLSAGVLSSLAWNSTYKHRIPLAWAPPSPPQIIKGLGLTAVSNSSGVSALASTRVPTMSHHQSTQSLRHFIFLMAV